MKSHHVRIDINTPSIYLCVWYTCTCIGVRVMLMHGCVCASFGWCAGVRMCVRACAMLGVCVCVRVCRPTFCVVKGL